MVGLFALVLAVTLSRKISVVGALFAVAILLAVLSRVNLLMLAKRVWLIVLGFTGVIAHSRTVHHSGESRSCRTAQSPSPSKACERPRC